MLFQLPRQVSGRSQSPFLGSIYWRTRSATSNSRATSDAGRRFEQQKAKIDLRIDELKHVAWEKGKFIREATLAPSKYVHA
jgi:hypothetical protein